MDCSIVRTIFGAALVGGLAAVSLPAQSAVIRAEDILHGTNVTEEQCSDRRNTVWVTAYGRGICIRYYGSTVGGRGDWPIVYLSGDKPTYNVLHRNQRSKKVRSRREMNRSVRKKAKDVDTRRLVRRANSLSRAGRTTAIYLARMGLDGSSGHHGLRRTMLDLHITNAALDAIKRRHRFAGFNLVGQSGGSTLIGGLLALRDDLNCVVPGSGRLVLMTQKKKVRDPALRRFDPAEMIPAIVRHRNARILVVTDPRDQIVKAKHQNTFVRRLLEAGRPVEQFHVRSPSKKRHSVTVYASFVAGRCVRGQSYEKIAADLDTFTDRVLERARQISARRAERRRRREEPRR